MNVLNLLGKECTDSHHNSTAIQVMLCLENEHCYVLGAVLKRETALYKGKKTTQQKNPPLMKDENNPDVTLGTYVTIRS